MPSRQRGAEEVMWKRNQALEMLSHLPDTDLPTEEVCELVRQVLCGDEGPTVFDVFPKEQAEKIVRACKLVCGLEPEE